jgi:signal transduction histidine kinase
MKLVLLPRSLFWRVLGVIAIGLLLLQGFSFYLSYVERDRVIAFSAESFMLDRFVQLVEVVESLPPEQRAKVLKLFGRGPFKPELRSQGLGGAEGRSDPRAREVAEVLRQRLGRDRAIESRYYKMEIAPFAIPLRGDQRGIGAQRVYRKPGLGTSSVDPATGPAEEAASWYEPRAGVQLLERGLALPVPDALAVPSVEAREAGFVVFGTVRDGPEPEGGPMPGKQLYWSRGGASGGVAIGSVAGGVRVRTEPPTYSPAPWAAAPAVDSARVLAKPAGEPGIRLPPPPPLPGLHEVGDAVEVAAQLKDGQWLASSFGLMHRRILSAPPPQYGDWVVTLIGVLIIALIAAVAVVWPLRKFARSVDDYVADLSLPPMKESGPREVVSATRALNRLHDRLGSLLRSRTQMLTAVSHDLKTPVTRLRLRAELLEEGELKQKINGDLDDMEALIGSTLDYFRAGSPGDSATRVDLGALLHEIVSEAPQWQDCVTVQHSDAIEVLASRPSLRRVFTNLIDNAVKYGGRADIALSRKDGFAQVAIRDRGPGIPEDELEKVFEPFYRVERSRSRETGGSGLGLAIAREIAQACGAAITLRNTGPGLEAVVRLPA